MKKKLMALLLVSAMAVATMLTACGSTATPEESKEEETAEETADDAASVKIALIIPGQITDMGWSTQGYNGLKRAEEELGAEIAYAESVTDSDAEEYIRGYANDGYNLIIGHGSQYADALKAVAASYPDTWFVVTSSSEHEGDNMAAYSNNNCEQGYLAGTVAAAYSQSGKIGYIGGKEITPFIQKKNNAELGIAAVNPDAEYNAIIMGTTDDLQLAQENAKAMIESGVDVIIGNADKATETIIQVCQENGIACVALGDYYSTNYADTQTADVINDAATCIFQACKDYVDGTIKADANLLGTAVNAVFVTNVAEWAPADVQAAVDAAVEALSADKVELIY